MPLEETPARGLRGAWGGQAPQITRGGSAKTPEPRGGEGGWTGGPVPSLSPSLSPTPSCPHPRPRPAPVPLPTLPVIAARLLSRCDRSLPGNKGFLSNASRMLAPGRAAWNRVPVTSISAVTLSGSMAGKGTADTSSSGAAGKRLPFGSRQQGEADNGRTNAFP